MTKNYLLTSSTQADKFLLFPRKPLINLAQRVNKRPKSSDGAEIYYRQKRGKKKKETKKRNFSVLSFGGCAVFIRPSRRSKKDVQNNNKTEGKTPHLQKDFQKKHKKDGGWGGKKLDNFLILAASKQPKKRKKKKENNISAERVVFDIFYGSMAFRSNI